MCLLCSSFININKNDLSKFKNIDCGGCLNITSINKFKYSYLIESLNLANCINLTNINNGLINLINLNLENCMSIYNINIV